MQYFGRFVPSVTNGSRPGEWERFHNAENPARQLKSRARERVGKFYFATATKKVHPIRTELRAYNDADMSAMMLIWLTREEPAPDEAPDEVWHLTNLGGLIRTPWSVIVDPVGELSHDVREPSISESEPDEVSVVDLTITLPQEVWRPPTLEDLAERRAILIGDKRPTSAGAYVERNVERFAPTGFRKPCPECGVVPNAFTLDCRCTSSVQ